MKRLKLIFRILFTRNFVVCTEDRIEGNLNIITMLCLAETLHKWIKQEGFYCHFEVSKDFNEIMNLE